MAVTGRAREYYAKSLDFTAKCQQEECFISFFCLQSHFLCVSFNFPKKKGCHFSKMAIQTSLLQDIWIKPNEAAQRWLLSYICLPIKTCLEYKMDIHFQNEMNHCR